MKPDEPSTITPEPECITHEKQSWRRKLLKAGLVVMLLIVVTIAAAVERVAHCLPAPSGSFVVGRTTLYWTDVQRPETQTKDPGDFRQVRADLWYPAEISTGSRHAAYCPD